MRDPAVRMKKINKYIDFIKSFDLPGYKSLHTIKQVQNFIQVVIENEHDLHS